jgi:hypothetical protein
MTQKHCPDPKTLALILDDSASTTESSLEIRSHVDACVRCQTQLSIIADDAELRSWRESDSFRRREGGIRIGRVFAGSRNFAIERSSALPTASCPHPSETTRRH